MTLRVHSFAHPHPRRGRNVMDYAAEGSEVRRVLEARIAEMESRAARLQVRRVTT